MLKKDLELKEYFERLCPRTGKKKKPIVAVAIQLMMDKVSKLSSIIGEQDVAAAKLTEAISKHDFASLEEYMQYCAQTIRPLMDEIREYADALEAEVVDDFWPLPTHQEMLFVK